MVDLTLEIYLISLVSGQNSAAGSVDVEILCYIIEKFTLQLLTIPRNPGTWALKRFYFSMNRCGTVHKIQRHVGIIPRQAHTPEPGGRTTMKIVFVGLFLLAAGKYNPSSSAQKSCIRVKY